MHPLVLLYKCLLLAAVTLAIIVPTQAQIAAESYSLIGVSGGLQEGFPAHAKLHYQDNDGSVVKALYLGRGLVRGYKAFLDLMEPSWREYTPETADQPPVINSNVFASGCYEHANEYWLYLVDSRHVLSILNNEPRFLSMTPDTGMIELGAINGTSPLVRNFLTAHVQQHRSASFKEITHVSIPLVTCVYFQENSHIPSPTFYTLDEGVTQVTNFPDSLAMWAKVNDNDRTAVLDTTKRCNNKNKKIGKTKEKETKAMDTDCGPSVWALAVKAEQRYWHGIREAIRYAEAHRPSKELLQTYAPPFQCHQKIRFGVGKEDDPENTSTRVNYPFTVTQVADILQQVGFRPDFGEGEIIPVPFHLATGTGGDSEKDVPDL